MELSDFSKHAALFAAGTLFGSIGLKLLGSKDAQKVYVHAAAAGLRIKDQAMETATCVQEGAADILAAAKELNEERAAKEEARKQAAAIEHEAEIADEAETEASAEAETEE